MHSRLFLLILICAITFPTPVFAMQDVFCDASVKNNLWRKNLFIEDTKKIQRHLSSESVLPKLSPQAFGLYGPTTEQAVSLFQKKAGIYESGTIGSMTRRLINSMLCGTPIESFDPKTFFPVDSADTPKLFDKRVLLPIPLIEQKYRLSCEAASIQMALLYKRIELGQDEIMNQIGYALPKKKYTHNGRLVWGDPDAGFVGDVSGHVYVAPLGLLGATGWGVNEKPVENMVRKYAPETYSKIHANLDDIMTALDASNPVIVWHKDDDMTQSSLVYFTPEGKEVLFTSTHVSLIVGYDTIGPETWFWVNDPTYGRLRILSEDFVRYWSRFDNRMVVVQ